MDRTFYYIGIAFFGIINGLFNQTWLLLALPAALYERVVGAKDDSTEASLWIWLAGTAILTLPAMGNFFDIRL